MLDAPLPESARELLAREEIWVWRPGSPGPSSLRRGRV